MDISTYIPRKARGVAGDDGFFAKNDFIYDPEQDVYICPNKCILNYKFFVKGFGSKRYRSKALECNNCPLRCKCLRGKQKCRPLDRSYHWTEYEKQHENDGSDDYRTSLLWDSPFLHMPYGKYQAQVSNL